MKRGGAHALGIAVTALLHVGLVVVATAGGASNCGGGAEASDFVQAETIEASLAFKKVAPKDRQPQKQKKQKYAPVDAQKLATDPNAVPPPPEPEDKKPKLAPREDEIDPASVLRKNREQDESLSSTGSEELPVEGQDDGSEWGTERDAKGDPYVGELVGRIKSGWTVPSLEQGSGVAVGCVRLDAEGKIRTHELKEPSKNANLDRSVEEALRSAPSMETPVPEHLLKLLTVKGICINFKLES